MIALYHGISGISRAIRFVNWSDYSHAAWITSEGSCIEAWITSAWRLKGKVMESPRFDTNHTKGTKVDYFAIPTMTPEQERQITFYMRTCVGQRYDFGGVLKFLSRTPGEPNDRWFCSEVIFSACESAKIWLLRLPAWKVFPGMLAYSPLVEYQYTKVCGEGVVK
jgi:hypothetical protein